MRIERNLTDLYTGLVPELDSISDTTLGKLAVLPLPGCGSKTKLVIPLCRANLHRSLRRFIKFSCHPIVIFRKHETGLY